MEMMYLAGRLRREETKSIIDMVQGHCLEQLAQHVPVLSNPMGVAVFDIVLGKFYQKK